MNHKTYRLSTRLPAKMIIERVGDLLARAGVKYRSEGLYIFSISTPIALFSIRTLWSDRNWVGLNPFTYISGVEVRCQPGKSGFTEVIVRVNKTRAFLWVVIYALISVLAALDMPKPEGAFLFVAVSLAAWWVLVCFLGGYLIKKEIADCLNG